MIKESDDTLTKLYQRGYQRGRANAIDEFVSFANEMPTIEDKDGYIRPMTLEEMAEQLKEKNNV